MTIVYASSLRQQRSQDIATAISNGVAQVLNSGLSLMATLQLSSSMISLLPDGSLVVSGLPLTVPLIGAGGTASFVQIASSDQSYVLVSGIPVEVRDTAGVVAISGSSTVTISSIRMSGN